jgi:predicted DNA-binding transcriptional regulator YafY
LHFDALFTRLAARAREDVVVRTLSYSADEASSFGDYGYHAPMGQRSRTETVAAVLAAFLARRTWPQAELARVVGVRPETIRKLLEELLASGVPLESEKEHPHVYWSMPKTWYPGGVLFKQDDVPELLRQLRHLPRSKSRDRLLAIVADQLPMRATPAMPPVVLHATSEHEEQYVPIVEDAAGRKVPLFMRYLTVSRGKVSERHASVHLVDLGPPARFIATCHRNGDLRWFRVDGIVHARLDDREPFRGTAADLVAPFRAASLDGYKGEGDAVECSFFVREPESSWVANNLLEGMRAETLHDGIRVSIETSAVLRLARFVVGFGGAARPENAALAEAVVELAQGALDEARLALQHAESAAIPEEPLSDPVRLRSDV